MNKTTNKFSPEVRERAVRMVLDNGATVKSGVQAIIMRRLDLGLMT